MKKEKQVNKIKIILIVAVLVVAGIILAKFLEPLFEKDVSLQPKIPAQQQASQPANVFDFKPENSCIKEYCILMGPFDPLFCREDCTTFYANCLHSCWDCCLTDSPNWFNCHIQCSNYVNDASSRCKSFPSCYPQ